MKFACHLLGHRAAPHAVANRGFQFSRCRRCRCDMVRSNQPASSNWTVVPPTFRVAWNDVDPDAMFSWNRPAPLRRVRAILWRGRTALWRIRTALSAALDCVLVSSFVTLLMMRDRLRHLVSSHTRKRPRIYMVTSEKFTQPAREWQFSGTISSVPTNVSFQCVVRKDDASLACG
jgi:hypothetical protein